jgi:hypothetical protein
LRSDRSAVGEERNPDRDLPRGSTAALVLIEREPVVVELEYR